MKLNRFGIQGPAELHAGNFTCVCLVETASDPNDSDILNEKIKGLCTAVDPRIKFTHIEDCNREIVKWVKSVEYFIEKKSLVGDKKES